VKRPSANLSGHQGARATGARTGVRTMAIIIGTDGNDKYPDGTELRGTNGDDQI
jgi:hypothetical protein